ARVRYGCPCHATLPLSLAVHQQPAWPRPTHHSISPCSPQAASGSAASASLAPGTWAACCKEKCAYQVWLGGAGRPTLSMVTRMLYQPSGTPFFTLPCLREATSDRGPARGRRRAAPPAATRRGAAALV